MAAAANTGVTLMAANDDGMDYSVVDWLLLVWHEGTRHDDDLHCFGFGVVLDLEFVGVDWGCGKRKRSKNV